MSHIFISYSRKDLDFAQKIVDALAANNLDTWIDWKSIPKGGDWEQEIYRGIEEADAFLFLISPDSVASEMCNKEIAHAVKNGKRILPIFISKVKDDEVRTVIEKFLYQKQKEEISRRNFIFCRDGQDDFNIAVEDIHKAIHTDHEWLKFHTELQVRALKWEKKKDNSRLLRGKDLKEAEQKLATKGDQDDPQPTSAQRNYLLKSRQHADYIRRAITWSSIGVAIIMVLLSLVAWEQRNTAISESNAKATALVEEHARATAQAEKERAEEQAQIALSRQLAAQSVNQLNENNWDLAILLAIESGRTNNNAEAFSAIRKSLAHPGRTRMIFQNAGAQWSPDGISLLIIEDDKASIWDIEKKTEQITFPESERISRAIWNKDESRVLTDSFDNKSARIWDAKTGRELSTFQVDDWPTGAFWAVWSPDGTRVLTSRDGTLEIRGVETGDIVIQLPTGGLDEGEPRPYRIPEPQKINLTPALGDVVGAFKTLVFKVYLDWIKVNDPSRRAKFWQGNYYEHIIRNDRELNAIRRYIIDNPRNWNLDRDNLENLRKIPPPEKVEDYLEDLKQLMTEMDKQEK